MIKCFIRRINQIRQNNYTKSKITIQVFFLVFLFFFKQKYYQQILRFLGMTNLYFELFLKNLIV